MTALSSDGNARIQGPQSELISFPVAGSTTIYRTELACLNTSGYLTNGSDTSGYRFAGIAMVPVDNSSGSDADLYCQCRVIGEARLTTSGASAASVGLPVYLSDNNTVTFTPTNVFVGICIEYHSATSITVRFDAVGLMEQSGKNIFEASAELDLDTDADTEVLIPAWWNTGTGIVVPEFFAIVTEALAGATEDQAVVTLQDTAGNSLSVTVTFADGSADAVGDIRRGVTSYDETGTPDGTALTKLATTARGIQAKVTTPTSGAGAAGKCRVVIRGIRY